MFIKPRLSEKAFAQSQATNTFTVDVPVEANKYEVADALAKQFDVEVKSVRLVNRKGKTKRVMNTTGKRSSNQRGSQNDIKKAYVTLKEGSHLPFFAAAEEEIAKANEAKAKEAKKADKPAKKEAK
ncbi:MAG: large subunit ribosomal protein [Patescibacteria group bacterium]|nr:50S ribosomal protein L23 [Candidatus Saccharibacteria bacterium]MDQ5963429.1 large subunit ribosomal protein [Patescibacteria group bacterium]